MARRSISQRRDLLGYQADQKDDDRGAEQQHAHVSEAAFVGIGIAVIRESKQKEKQAGGCEKFYR